MRVVRRKGWSRELWDGETQSGLLAELAQERQDGRVFCGKIALLHETACVHLDG